MKEDTKKIILEALEAFLVGIDNAQKPLLNHMSKVSLKDLTDDEEKAGYVSVLSQYQQLVGLVDTVTRVTELLKAPPKPKEEAISSFGFMSSEKKAA